MSIIDHIKQYGIKELEEFETPELLQDSIWELEGAILAIQGQLDSRERKDDPDWWRRAIGAIRFYKLALKRLNVAKASQVDENSRSRAFLKSQNAQWRAFAKHLADQLEAEDIEIDLSMYPEAMTITFDEWMDEE